MPKLNHDAWEIIFQKLNILSNLNNSEYYDISADDIKKYGNREPRLMAKIDYEEVLPDVMKENGLSILAISNGLYRIAKTNPFMKIKPFINGNVETIIPRKDILTIDPFSIKTESQILDICSANGVLEKVFGETTNLTIRGRVRIDSDISFNLGSIPYDVFGVQVEVDGGYEGMNSINLIEAKIGGRENLSIRQLAYPELFWKTKTHNKVVKSYVLLYEKSIIRFIPFLITPNGQFSLNSGDERRFQFLHLNEQEFDLSKIPLDKNLLKKGTPFPQANDLDKVIAMFTYIISGYTSKNDLSNEFDMVDRQIYYYYSVLEWLGICEYQDDLIALTERGKSLSKFPKIELIKELAKLVFSSKIFQDFLKNGKDGIDESDFREYDIGGSTVPRRLQTVDAWIKYFKANLQ